MKKKLSILLTLALATLVTTGCEGLDEFFASNKENETEQKEEQQETEKSPEEGEEEQQQQIKVESITLEEDEITLNIGDTCRIQYTVLPASANQEVIFDSEDDQICSVDKTGLVTALNSGTTSIRITSIENRSKFADLGIHINEKETPPEVDPPVIDPPAVTNYTVTFNGNGADSGSMSPQTTNGSTYVAPSCGFTKNNHSFDGWALDSVTGTKYAIGSTIQNISKDITLFATWVANPTPVTNYTVSFNGNGADGGSMANQTTQGSSYTVPNCQFTCTNHSFKEWALNSATGTRYSVPSTITNISSNITLYAIWEENQVTPPDPNDYYAACEGLTGSALQAKLLEINKPKSTSYAWSRYEDADEAEDDPTCILSIYTRHNIPKNNHCGSYSWTTWNREHIWTQTAFPNSASDNHNIFACEGKINGIRSNYIFDEGGDIVEVFGHVTECRYKSGTSFEPCDAAKGEVARAVMYGTVMYSYTMTDEIKSIELALKWHLQHEITSRETKRNDIVQGNQGNRNPFVDHPEYACKIWGNTNAATKALCGGN